VERGAEERLALIKGHGYRIRDCMYYVKEKGYTPFDPYLSEI
jgi:hypothetical protein